MQRADELYRAGQVHEAIRLMEPVYQDEPENPFVAELYGRALFRAGRRAEAFPVYQRLIAVLDRQGTSRNTGAATITVDFWFIDAYWKKGLMHLDRAEWGEAAFEISRAYRGMTSAAIVEQALQYLTEAFFYLGDREVAQYYADQTLRHNPSNTYVLRFVEALRRGGR